MLDKGAPLSFVGFWHPSPPPPNAHLPSPDATIFNYLNDREGGAIILYDFSAPRFPMPQYLAILMAQKGVRHYLL